MWRFLILGIINIYQTALLAIIISESPPPPLRPGKGAASYQGTHVISSHVTIYSPLISQHP